MPDDAGQLTTTGGGGFGNLVPEIPGRGLPPSLQILLNQGLYDRIKQLSGVMARAQGFTPVHLLGKPEACFVVINIALDARLNPSFVARHTYQTPSGAIGYDGALVQALLEASGKFVGQPQFEYSGNWSKVIGKFEKKTSQRGGEYIKAVWTEKDAEGCGVIVRWQVKGEAAPRTWPGEGDPFLLTQCYPLNSPLWATDPKSQIAYLSIRRFANLAAPGILGAAGFDDGELLDASERAIDVTPAREPARDDFTDTQGDRTGYIRTDETGPTFEVTDLDGQVIAYSGEYPAGHALQIVLADASRQSADRLDAAWENNEGLIGAINAELRDELVREYADLREKVIDTAKRESIRRAGLEEGYTVGAVGGAVRGTPEPGNREPGGTPAPGAGPTSVEQGVVDKTIDPPAAGDRPAPPRSQTAPLAGEPEQSSQPASTAPPRAAERPEQPDGGSPRSEARGEGPANEDGQRAPAGQGAAPAPQSDHASLFIVPPLKRGGDKPDLRAWAVALFLPKVRRCTTNNDLAWLLGDNAETISACRSGGLEFNELAEFDRTITEQWAKVSIEGLRP